MRARRRSRRPRSAARRGPPAPPGPAAPDRCRSREPPTLLKVERSIAEGRDAPGSSDLAVGRARAVGSGLGIAVLGLVLYVLGNDERLNSYNHFVWQADAFLHGRVNIPYP